MQSQLFVSDSKGNYQPASENHIVGAASKITAQRLTGKTLASPAETAQYLILKLSRLEIEEFHAVFLDNRHRVISLEKLFSGTLNGAAVYPREVIKRALKLNAAAIIFAHNHPSGVAEPSQADEQLTQRLRDALALVEVRVLDHIIIGGDSHVSFAERGLI